MLAHMSEFVLYSYFRSSASYRARIALHLKRIEFEYRAVHLLNNGGEQRSVEYQKLNPSQQVPTLVHNGRAIGQSMAILEYLDQVRPDVAQLFPDEAYERALVVQACEIVNSGIQPLHNLSVLQLLEKRFGADEAQKNEWTRHWLESGLEALETFLKPHADDYCFGNEVTAADCFLIPNLANADRFEVSLEKFRTLSRIRGNCEGLDGFRKASPKLQPDTPANV